MTLNELLFHMAEDAFDVLNWARREGIEGMKKDRQLQEVVSAYEKTLAETQATINLKD
jgi:hypothetical protein